MEFEDPKRAKYKDIKQVLLKRFGFSDIIQIHEKALSHVKLVKGQSVYDVAHEIRLLTKKAYPDLSPQARERFERRLLRPRKGSEDSPGCLRFVLAF